MIVAIHQPHYLPWLRYIHKVASCDVFVVLDDVQYTKNGWQNRNRIKGPNGPFLLTVPVRDATFRPITEVEVDPQISWRQKHWKSMLLSYAKAPYFPRWRDAFEEIYTTEWTSLASLNLRVLEALIRAFGIQTRLVRSSEIGAAGFLSADLAVASDVERVVEAAVAVLAQEDRAVARRPRATAASTAPGTLGRVGRHSRTGCRSPTHI